jgi:hypothetical protein
MKGNRKKALRIYNNSDLLIQEDCKIIDGVLYELCKESKPNGFPKNCYRFFIEEDDYDYVTDAKLCKRLNNHFGIEVDPME